ncbi:MAG: toll/interleukin-1 receptor domain-containing protein [Fusobacteriaceae bacterium]|nr:toll/interleukin-1 receptor domain-containing protein [Fusobacteriaceae bacterium]MBN2837184.1 toll/interleukin-1 receptor domain-containing protein [Fusobacteriaceae bacterium]
MKKKETLRQLIEEGELLISNSFNRNYIIEESRIANLITGEKHPPKYKNILIIEKEKGTLWKNNCITYLNYQLLNKDEKEKFEAFFPINRILGKDISKTSMEQSLSHLKSLYEHYPFEEAIILDNNINNKVEKIFISHAEKDSEYIKLFVKLLNNIGIINKDKIFCSSIIDYGIPNREKIYEYIKEEFNQNVFVIFFLSNNYYKSAASLNEMGATWIKSNEYQAILLPNFEFGDMRGAVDPSAICFKINEKERLNHFKEDLSKFFELNIVGPNHWEDARDEFLGDVERLIERDKKKPLEINIEKVKKAGDNIEVYIRTLNLTNNPIEILEIDLELIDKSGKVFENTLELNQNIFPNENRVDMQIIEVGSTEFNGNRVDYEKSKIEVHI